MIAGFLILLLHSFIWFVHFPLQFRRNLRGFLRLPRHAPDSGPAVAVLVPARNEEKMVRRAVESLARQSHRNLQVIVANDHSTDRTRERIDRVARRYPGRMVVFDVPDLPAGWMGKCHALWQCRRRVKGTPDFLLFCDADVVHDEQTVAGAVALMERERLDLLAILPRVHCVGFWEHAVLPTLMNLGVVQLNPARVQDPTKRDFAGIGAFTMIRRDLYDSWGGHKPIRSEVIDDMALGLMAKRAGGRLGLATDPTAVRLRMYDSLESIERGFEKNMFAAVGSNFPRALAGAIAIVVLHTGPLAAALVGLMVLLGVMQGAALTAMLMIALAILIHVLTGWSIARRTRLGIHGKEKLIVAGYFLGAMIAARIMVRSAWHGRVRGMVRWRGRDLPFKPQKTRMI